MEDLKKLLQRSYDDDLSTSEKQRLESGLLNSEELRKEKVEIESVRTILSGFNPQFDSDFSDRLMQKLEVHDTDLSLSFYTIVKGIAISGVAAIVALLISIYFIDGSLNIDAIYGISDYAPDEAAIAFFNL